MNLQDIDVSSQSLDASIDGIKDMLAGQADAVHVWAIVLAGKRNRRLLSFVINAEEALGENDDAVTRDVVFLQGFAYDFFGAAVGVDVGLVGSVSTAIMVQLWGWTGGRLVQCPKC